MTASNNNWYDVFDENFNSKGFRILGVKSKIKIE